jgi:hypothetical protein
MLSVRQCKSRLCKPSCIPLSIYWPIGDRFFCHGFSAIFPKLSSNAATGRPFIADSKPRLLNERLAREWDRDKIELRAEFAAPRRRAQETALGGSEGVQDGQGEREVVSRL